MKVVYQYVEGAWDRAVKNFSVPIARACTAAIKDAGDLLKAAARGSIRSGGFSSKWANATRVRTYPEGGQQSIDAAAFLWHKIDYANIFEKGGRVLGSPMLWIPLATTPRKAGRHRLTVRVAKQQGVKLLTMRTKSGKPLLGARVRLPAAQSLLDRPKLSLATLRRGDVGRGIPTTVPLFVGIRAATQRKRFNVAAEARRVRDMLPTLYVKHFRDTDG